MNKYQRRLLGINRARRVLRVMRATSSYLDPHYYDDGGEYAKHLLHTRKSCSCRMCRNAREMEGPTRQERMVETWLENDG